MRIHVVTPKAPVTVDFSVRIQVCPGFYIILLDDLILLQADRMDEQTGSYFHPGIVAEAPIQLSMARYYVMRLPYVYLGPSGDPVHAPSYPDYQGRLIRNCIKVRQISLP
jgi:hypothetical protein